MTDESRIRGLEAEIDDLTSERNQLETDLSEASEKARDRAREVQRLARVAFGPEDVAGESVDAFAFWRALEDLSSG